jgi:hypothetical protein
MNRWRLDRFKSLIGQTLTARELDSDNKYELKVTEVIESTSVGEGWESFAVIMQCADSSVIEQGCLEFSHESYGVTTLFVNSKSETEFEAVFNYEL